MKRNLLRLAMCCVALGVTGCNWFLPLAFVLPDTKTVPAEFALLENTTVVVMVWAEPETLFDYPYARLELASYVGDKIRREVDGVHVINARKVEDYIQREPAVAHDPRRVGEHFEAEMVVYLELLQFQIRDPDAPEFIQGVIQTAVRVHDLSSDPDEAQSYELQEVAVSYPDQPALFTPSGEQLVRRETYVAFGEAVARKFYDHEEAL